MKNNTILKVMLVSVIMVIVGCIISFSCFFNGADIGLSQFRVGPFGLIRWDKDTTAEIGNTYTYEAKSEITSFSLDASIGDVTIHRGNEFKVEAKNIAKNAIETTEENGEFKFSIRNDSISSSIISFEHKIVVTLPESVKVVKADIDLGDIDIIGLSLTSLNIDCNAGDVELQNVTSETVVLDLDMGSLEFDGDVTKSLEVDCNAGDADITMARNELSYNTDASVQLGDLNINDQEYGQINAKYSRNNKATSYIKISLDMGDLEINFGYDD